MKKLISALVILVSGNVIAEEQIYYKYRVLAAKDNKQVIAFQGMISSNLGRIAPFEIRKTSGYPICIRKINEESRKCLPRADLTKDVEIYLKSVVVGDKIQTTVTTRNQELNKDSIWVETKKSKEEFFHISNEKIEFNVHNEEEFHIEVIPEIIKI